MFGAELQRCALLMTALSFFQIVTAAELHDYVPADASLCRPGNSIVLGVASLSSSETTHTPETAGNGIEVVSSRTETGSGSTGAKSSVGSSALEGTTGGNDVALAVSTSAATTTAGSSSDAAERATPGPLVSKTTETTIRGSPSETSGTTSRFPTPEPFSIQRETSPPGTTPGETGKGSQPTEGIFGGGVASFAAASRPSTQTETTTKPSGTLMGGTSVGTAPPEPVDSGTGTIAETDGHRKTQSPTPETPGGKITDSSTDRDTAPLTAPSGITAGPAPFGITAGPAPSGITAGPAPSGITAGPGMSGPSVTTAWPAGAERTTDSSVDTQGSTARPFTSGGEARSPPADSITAGVTPSGGVGAAAYTTAGRMETGVTSLSGTQTGVTASSNTEAGVTSSGGIKTAHTPAGSIETGVTSAGDTQTGVTQTGGIVTVHTPAGSIETGVTQAGVTQAGVTQAGVTPAGVIITGHTSSGGFETGYIPAGDLDAGFTPAGGSPPTSDRTVLLDTSTGQPPATRPAHGPAGSTQSESAHPPYTGGSPADGTRASEMTSTRPPGPSQAAGSLPTTTLAGPSDGPRNSGTQAGDGQPDVTPAGGTQIVGPTTEATTHAGTSRGLTESGGSTQQAAGAGSLSTAGVLTTTTAPLTPATSPGPAGVEPAYRGVVPRDPQARKDYFYRLVSSFLFRLSTPPSLTVPSFLYPRTDPSVPGGEESTLGDLITTDVISTEVTTGEVTGASGSSSFSDTRGQAEATNPFFDPGAVQNLNTTAFAVVKTSGPTTFRDSSSSKDLPRWYLGLVESQGVVPLDPQARREYFDRLRELFALGQEFWESSSVLPTTV